MECEMFRRKTLTGYGHPLETELSVKDKKKSDVTTRSNHIKAEGGSGSVRKMNSGITSWTARSQASPKSLGEMSDHGNGQREGKGLPQAKGEGAQDTVSS